MDESQTQGEADSKTSQPIVPISKPLDKDIEENKLVAALSYLGILFLVPLLVKRESPFCQFHAKQGLVFCIIFFVGWILFMIPVLGWLAWLAVVILDIVALVKTLSGERWEVPIIGDLAKKINI